MKVESWLIMSLKDKKIINEKIYNTDRSTALFKFRLDFSFMGMNLRVIKVTDLVREQFEKRNGR